MICERYLPGPSPRGARCAGVMSRRAWCALAARQGGLFENKHSTNVAFDCQATEVDIFASELALLRIFSVMVCTPTLNVLLLLLVSE